MTWWYNIRIFFYTVSVRKNVFSWIRTRAIRSPTQARYQLHHSAVYSPIFPRIVKVWGFQTLIYFHVSLSFICCIYILCRDLKYLISYHSQISLFFLQILPNWPPCDLIDSRQVARDGGIPDCNIMKPNWPLNW